MARMGKFMFSMAISFLISDTDSFEFCNPYRLCGVCMRIYERNKKIQINMTNLDNGAIARHFFGSSRAINLCTAEG